MKGGINADETNLLNVHNSTFHMGVACGLEAVAKSHNLISPIPQEMFEMALE